MRPLEPKNILDSMGSTNTELNELMGVTRSTIARWEIGIHQPHDQEHLKKCMNITKILLQADPENEEARALESLIRSVIRQDLDNARTFLDHAQLQEKPQVFGTGAEIILNRILSVDPNNQQATALMSELKARLSEVTPSPLALEGPKEAALELSAPLNGTEPAVPSSPVMARRSVEGVSLDREAWLRERIALHSPEPIPAPKFALRQSDATTIPSFDDVLPKRVLPRSSSLAERVPLSMLVIIATVLLILGVLFLGSRPSAPKEESTLVNSAELPDDHRDVSGERDASALRDVSKVALESSFNDQVKKQILASAKDQILTSTAVANLTPLAASVVEAGSSVVSADTKSFGALVVADQTGRLALNSPVTTDIYLDGKYLGSTPVTLELPAGPQTLEYRHQGLQKLVTHFVHPNETMATKITFEVTVQVNAEPWAQVFLEGSEKQILGQTPLSGIVVPVGSTLVFENPNFPRKRYQVTGKDTAIRVVFP
jgi:transcriptional regulator with XRE-family HTH domain